MPRFDKPALIGALRARVEHELRTLRESQRAAQEGAIHEETRQEDPKDTRAIEAQYISRGLADRVEDLQRAQAALLHVRPDPFSEEDAVAVSALVGLNAGGKETVYFLVSVAGGETLVHDGTPVRTLTPVSPLGAALCGKHVGDDIKLDLPGRRLAAVIDWVE